MKTSYIYSVLFLIIFYTFPAIAATEPLATLNGEPITEKQVDTIASKRMAKITSQIYDIKRDAIDQIINNRLLETDAKKQGLTVAKLRQKVMNDTGPVTESEAQAIYQLQKKRFNNKSFDEVKTNLMKQLSSQKKQMAINDYIDELRNKAKIKINLERPRTKVSVDDDPSKGGGKDATVTIIEFSEFQCPFCKRVRPTINKILAKYGNKVHYVFRDFPLSFHRQAKDAANAAQCANDQGKYWEFSEELWKNQGQQSKKQLAKIAEGLKLNMDKFNACVSSNKYYDEINKDQQDGMNAGVTGTPAYFINGMFLSGAQPYEAFEKLIEEELNK